MKINTLKTVIISLGLLSSQALFAQAESRQEEAQRAFSYNITANSNNSDADRSCYMMMNPSLEGIEETLQGLIVSERRPPRPSELNGLGNIASTEDVIFSTSSHSIINTSEVSVPSIRYASTTVATSVVSDTTAVPSIFAEPVFLEEKTQCAQIIQQMIKASKQEEDWKQYYTNADELWAQSQKAWEERTTATWEVEAKSKALAQANERLERAKRVFENTDLNKTTLGRIASLANMIAQGATMVPGVVGQGTAGVIGVVDVAAGTINHFLEHAPIDAAELAQRIAEYAVNMARDESQKTNLAAPGIQQAAEQAELQARIKESTTRKEMIERLEPPVTSFSQSEWNSWTTLMIQAGRGNPTAIPLLAEHGLCDPLWASETVQRAWEEAEEDEFYAAAEQKKLRLASFQEAYNNASAALNKAREITTTIQEKATEAEALLKSALQIREHWKNELETISAALDELERPGNKRKPDNEKAIEAIEEKQKEWSHALAQFNESCNKLPLIEEQLANASAALADQEEKILILSNQCTTAKKTFQRNQERITTLQDQGDQEKKRARRRTFRLPQLIVTGEETLNEQRITAASLSFRISEEIEKKIKFPLILNKVYEIVGRSLLETQERKKSLRPQTGTSTTTEAMKATTSSFSSTGAMAGTTEKILLPEIRNPSQADLARWKTLETAKEYIEENKYLIATIKARIPQSGAATASVANRGITAIHTDDMGGLEEIEEADSSESENNSSNEVEQELNLSVEYTPTSYQNSSNYDCSSSPQLPSSISHLPSLAAAAGSPASIRPDGRIIVISQRHQARSEASSRASTAIEQARSESVASYIRTETSQYGSVTGSIPASVRSAATAAEKKAMDTTLNTAEVEAKKWVEMVRLADKARVAAGGTPFPDEASLFEAWQQADLTAEAAWEKKERLREEEEQEKEMAEAWEPNTRRWEARATVNALELEREVTEQELKNIGKPTVWEVGDPNSDWNKRKNTITNYLEQLEKELMEAQTKWTQLAKLELEKSINDFSSESSAPLVQILPLQEVKFERLKDQDQAVLDLFEKVMERESQEKEIEIAKAKKARLKQEGKEYTEKLNSKRNREVGTYLAAPTDQEQGAQELYIKETMGEALYAAREKIPEAEKAWETRISIAQNAQQTAQKMADSEKNNAATLLTAKRVKTMLEIDKQALVVLQEEIKRLEKIEAIWKRQLEVDKRAPALRRLTAVRDFHLHCNRNAWAALPHEEQEIYNEVVDYANAITTVAEAQELQETKKWAEELRENAHQFQKKFLILPSTKKRAKEVAIKAERALKQLILQEEKRKEAIRWAQLTSEERETEIAFTKRVPEIDVEANALRLKIKNVEIIANTAKDQINNVSNENAILLWDEAIQKASDAEVAWDKVIELYKRSLSQFSKVPQRFKSHWIVELENAEDMKATWATSVFWRSSKKVASMTLAARNKAETESNETAILLWDEAINMTKQTELACVQTVKSLQRGRDNAPERFKSWWIKELENAEDIKENWSASVTWKEAKKAASIAFAAKSKAEHVLYPLASYWDEAIQKAHETELAYDMSLKAFRNGQSKTSKRFKNSWDVNIKKIQEMKIAWNGRVAEWNIEKANALQKNREIILKN
ncbi:MAG TPA: hypothetical protein VJK54_06875 [Chthoniobacterales bacterium]|nr:hypothetical protein [Chthoniobacterales bacterium]